LIAAGFVAQLIDGALGMAYGVTCSSLLLNFGYSPLSASAAVHMAEVVTSGVSGHFHWRLGNVDRLLFRRLLWPGIAGGVLGAYALSRLPAERLTPFIAAYLFVMGARIIYKAIASRQDRRAGPGQVEIIGFAGGLCDAMGGGGWGPIVTASLVGNGHDPRMAIGTANRAEFFVTIAQAATFVGAIGIGGWRTAAALCVGGALAAPLAALATRRLEPRRLMLFVGLLVAMLSLRTLWLSL
jgi:uncharacterized membrane protein YfcA